MASPSPPPFEVVRPLIEYIRANPGQPQLDSFQELASSLDHWQIRQLLKILSERFSSITSPADPATRFPVEVRILIAKYFDVSDVHTLLWVSKSWRASWATGDCLEPLARRLFPGFLEYTRLQAKLASEEPDMVKALVNAAYYAHLRRTGGLQNYPRYKFYRSAFPLDEAFPHIIDVASKPIVDTILSLRPPRERENYSGSPRDPVYQSGRVAWYIPQSAPHLVVDDFRTLRRKIFAGYADSERRPHFVPANHYELILTNKLVGFRDHRKIYTWDLETGESNTLTLPNTPYKTLSSDYHLCFPFFGATATVVLWDVRRGSTELDISHIADSNFRHVELEVIFHPLLDDTIFIVGQTPSDLTTLISKFSNGVLEETYRFPDWCEKCRKPEIPDKRLEMTSKFGEFCVRTTTVPASCWGDSSTEEGSTPKQNTRVADCFNIWTGLLTRRVFPQVIDVDDG
ncbi:hypothetical protein B0T16DRAFT_453866 [Cercophora newfieldiana]|uniref:F-box domain-containing protein n=1 Tax=Cercophora newfieldiana TaxID=92897 RepID=A0AA39YEX4_9PEZI|nr:hypothetical protein B0T16DRAFT_453866 [Cercophora newfieldiana]